MTICCIEKNSVSKVKWNYKFNMKKEQRKTPDSLEKACLHILE